MRFEGKVALVTGAGSGIGAATARLFAQEGADVLLVSHTNDEIETLARDITNTGGKATALTADVSNDAAMQQLYQTVQTEHGRLDIVFANAGINGVWAPIEEITYDEWQRTIQTDLTGAFLTIKYAVPLLKVQGGAVIITSSINGTRVFSTTGATAYSCAKAAQVALAKMLALELAPKQVRVNVVCPGAIETDISNNTEQRHLDSIKIPVEYPNGTVPLTGGKPGEAGEVAELVAFLASDAAHHITGTEVWIDGAQSLLLG
jgi:NAD(P)-dependent dehydrogenase (short-subunit alcohol dehydrogenase family)